MSQFQQLKQETKPNYAFAMKKDISNNQYVNARYAPTGSETVGKPFPLYKDYGGRMTMWNSQASALSTIKKQMNLPTDTNAFRRGMISDAIGLGNDSLTNWVYGSQSLGNSSFDSKFCTSDADCTEYGKNYTCNSNYEPYPDSHLNQSGSICSYTVYPELNGEKYTRKFTEEGGIGKSCNTDNDCGSGYECNNSTDIFGKNVQQTGYCAQTYVCPDKKKRYIGYPYNSGIPVLPSRTQNNNGEGYSSKSKCLDNALSQQDCVEKNNKWFAVYPGYCPPIPSLRENSPQGALRTTSPTEKQNGFTIPAYANFNSSSLGGSKSENTAGPVGAFGAFSSQQTGMREPLQYSLSINPPIE